MGRVSPEAQARKNQYRKELRQWYKQHGICQRCYRDVEPGKTYCRKCLTYIRAGQIKRDPTGEKAHERDRKRRERLKAAGLCVNCGKEPAIEGQTLCQKCKKKARESQQVYKIRKRLKRQAEEERKAYGESIRTQ